MRARSVAIAAAAVAIAALALPQGALAGRSCAGAKPTILGTPGTDRAGGHGA